MANIHARKGGCGGGGLRTGVLVLRLDGQLLVLRLDFGQVRDLVLDHEDGPVPLDDRDLEDVVAWWQGAISDCHLS